MADDIEISEQPEGVGPHEGCELELMLAGKKPLAMFYEAVVRPVSDFYPEEDFMPHVESGALIRRAEIYHPRNGTMACHCVYYALPGEAWRLEEAHQLLKGSREDGKTWAEDDECKIGRLLGYSENEISVYLEWAKARRKMEKIAPAS